MDADGIAAAPAPGARPDAPTPLYQQHCAACHGASAPAAWARRCCPRAWSACAARGAGQVIAEAARRHADAGLRRHAVRPTRSPRPGQAWIYTPVTPAPAGATPTSAPRAAADRAARLPTKPLEADPMNLFVVVEGGDHHVSVLDGDRFEVHPPLRQRYALHGGPKFTPDGRYVFFGSRDGWITKYDLWNLPWWPRCAPA